MPKIRLSENALMVLEQRYLKRDEKGNVSERPEDLFRRVAKNIALADAKYLYPGKIVELEDDKKEFYEITETKEFQKLANNPKIRKTEKEFYGLMASLDFLPNSPTLLNAGRKSQQLAACFVLPIDDDISSIFMTLHDSALIHKTGAGTGFNFSKLRPKGDIIESSGVTSGPVSFMKIFDAATEQIKLGGKLRGANMGVLNVDHPDVEEAITAKKDPAILTNFNISIAITDRFIEAVLKNREYALVNYRKKAVVRKESARKIFDLICRQAWLNGDPGMLFIDTINKSNPTPNLGKLEATDSCGEQPLLDYESCNLGSINVSNFVSNKKIDYKKLGNTVRASVHFLDNVIDMCSYPLEKNRIIVEKNRKIGLGIMGFADLLIKMGIPYDSGKAISTAEMLMKSVQEAADDASAELGRKRGQFQTWESSIYSKKSSKRKAFLRNATRTTIAPTGTISIIASCSSGIEPLFALSYVRTTAEGKTLFYFNEELKKELQKLGLYSEDIVERIHRDGSISGIREIPEKLRKLFVVGSDIAPEWHVRMQAEFQKFVNNGISKTVTLPRHSSPDDVGKIFMMAHKLGCKGISIYRYGSREGQVISISSQRDEQITLKDWIRKK